MSIEINSKAFQTSHALSLVNCLSQNQMLKENKIQLMLIKYHVIKTSTLLIASLSQQMRIISCTQKHDQQNQVPSLLSYHLLPQDQNQRKCSLEYLPQYHYPHSIIKIRFTQELLKSANILITLSNYSTFCHLTACQMQTKYPMMPKAKLASRTTVVLIR